MRQRIYIWIAVAIVLLLVFSCKTRYVPVEIKTTETVEVHDTTITERLVPYKDSTATRDTVSFLSNLMRTAGLDIQVEYCNIRWEYGQIRYL